MSLVLLLHLLVSLSLTTQAPLGDLGVEAPSLSGADPAVRDQISEAQDAVLAADGEERGERLFLLGKIYLAYDFVEAARSAFEALARSSTQEQPSLGPPYYLSYCYERLGDPAAALEATAQVLRIEPRHVPTLVRRGRLLLEAGRPSEAGDAFELARASDQGCAAASYGLGEVARSEGQLEAAMAHYRAALSSSPQFTQARYALATTLRRAGRVDEARAELERTKIENSASVSAWEGCADPLLAEVRSLTSGASPHLMRGSLFHFAGDLEAAVEQYRLAAEAAPEDPVVQKTLAGALFGLGDRPAAEAHFREAVRLAPESASYRYDLAEVLRARGSLDEASELYRSAVEISPGFARAWARLGDLAFGSGRFDQAVTDYSRAVELAPGDSQSRATLGLALLRLGRREHGRIELSRALAAPPDDTSKYLELTEVLLLFGGVEEALSHLEAILARAPAAGLAARAHLWLGSVALGRGENETAREHLEKAVELDPALEQAKSALAQIPG